MKKTVIFGAGGTGVDIYERVLEKQGVVAFLDNNRAKWNTYIDGIKVIAPEKIADIECDEIIVASIIDPHGMRQQLVGYGIPEEKISSSLVNQPHNVRIRWLQDFAELLQDEPGNVAEAGVFRGDFAKEINRCFPEKKLYLFDTFDGFDKRDLDTPDGISGTFLKEGHLNNTSTDVVLNKMLYPEKCIIKKGWFPDSTEGVEDTFCFVNLDMDLYAPTLAGLKFFLPRLSPRGVILIHDYYAPFIDKYIKQAIADYESAQGRPLRLMPIGDGISIAICKV